MRKKADINLKLRKNIYVCMYIKQMKPYMNNNNIKTTKTCSSYFLLVFFLRRSVKIFRNLIQRFTFHLMWWLVDWQTDRQCRDEYGVPSNCILYLWFGAAYIWNCIILGTGLMVAAVELWKPWHCFCLSVRLSDWVPMEKLN